MAEPLCEGCTADFTGCCMVVETDPRDKRISELEAALRPFAAAVFNDNGDVTLSTGHLRQADYMMARKVLGI